MSVSHPTAQQFSTDLKDNHLVLVDFFATWCGPCKMFAPIFEETSADFDGRAAFLKVDIDEVPALAAQFGIQSVPSILLFKDGQLVYSDAGVKSKAVLTALLEKNM